MKEIYLFGALGRGFKTAFLVTSIFTYWNGEQECLIIPKVTLLEKQEFM